MRPTDALPHPADWSTDVVGRCVDIKRGVSWSKDQEHTAPYEGAVPVIGISNVQDRLLLDKVLYLSGLKPKAIEKRRIEQGWSVLVGSNGNRQRIGNAVYIAEDAALIFASFLIAAKPRADSGITPEFFFRWLRSEQVQSYLSASSEGSTGLSNLSHSFFRKMMIAFPGEAEQAAIARVLDAVDVAIDQAREAMAAQKALRYSLIVELLACGVGRSGRVRNSQAQPSEFELTPLGRLPRVWRLSDIKAEFQLQNGITLNEAQRSRRPKWRYLRVANVQRDALALSDVQMLEATEDEVTPRLLQQGDLLVVEGHADRMQIGRCALVTAEAVGMTFQNHLFRLRSNGAVVPAFGSLWLNSWQAQRYWNAMCATSSGLNTINQRMLKRLRIPVPPPSEQEQMVEIAAASKQCLAAVDAKLSSLQQLKMSLMHDLLTGTVRVDPALLQEQRT